MSAGKKPRDKGRFGDWIADRLLRMLIAAALSLPLRLRLWLMGRFVARIMAPLAGYRGRAMANLAHVWPELSEDRKRALADAVADQAGRTMIENYDPAGLIRRMARVPLHGPGVAAIEQARDQGQPVLFVTGHIGNFEAPRAALVARGYRIGGLYRPMSNPYFNAHYAANMHALSEPVFEQGASGTRGLIRHLRAGGMAVLLFDLYDSAGVPIPFMGQPAPTLTSAAEIARRTGALMVPFFGLRGPDGISFRLEFDAPIPHGDPVDMMRAATRALEDRVQAEPAQWFWIHRRWKPERQRRRAAARIGP